MPQKHTSRGATTNTSRKPRKQYSCLECQRRKQKCIYRDLNAQCQHCARRFPPVECVRAGSRAPQQLQVTVFQLGKQIGCVTKISKTKTITTGNDSTSQKSSRKSSDDTHDDAEAGETRNQSHQSAFVLSIRPRKPTVLDGRREDSINLPNWGYLGGILTEVGTNLNSFALKMTLENAELLHYYLCRVVPNFVSIDGETAPSIWKNNVLQWQLQSPLMPHFAILMAAMTMGLERGGNMANTYLVKADALNCINAYMASSTPANFKAVAAELVGCIVSMVVMEWFWGTEESMRAHHRGIKELLRLCGGIGGLIDPVHSSIMLLTDYEIACGFEEDLYWQQGDPMYRQAWITPVLWPERFDSPLVEGGKTFRDLQGLLGISSASAAVLDDVRFLICLITALPCDSPASKIKIQTTASWLHDRLIEGSPGEQSIEEDLFTETIRLAARIWAYSVITLTPFARYPDHSVLLALSEAVLQVPLSRWKTTPGIYLWVLLGLCPSTQADMRGKYIRRKMATTGLAIGFEDFVYSIGCLRACWKVQRWIAHKGSGRSWLQD